MIIENVKRKRNF